MPGDQEIKDKILDAAEQCLLEPGARVHAAIAERAGVSRPTVCEYVGDQDAIVAAIPPWFTVNAEPIIEMGMAFAGPHIKQTVADGDFPDVEPRVVVEWCCRLTLSWITTPGTVKIGDAAPVRRRPARHRIGD